MDETLKVRATVLPGKRIEIATPDLNEGDVVDVSVTRVGKTKLRSALEIIESLEGRRVFKSADEVDRYIREERDSWD
jgi:hypothetical protein